jgi:hypothetical protein
LAGEMSTYDPKITEDAWAQFMKCPVELRLFSCVAFPTGDAHAGASYIGRPVLGYLPRKRKIS